MWQLSAIRYQLSGKVASHQSRVASREPRSNANADPSTQPRIVWRVFGRDDNLGKEAD